MVKAYTVIWVFWAKYYSQPILDRKNNQLHVSQLEAKPTNSQRIRNLVYLIKIVPQSVYSYLLHTHRPAPVLHL